MQPDSTLNGFVDGTLWSSQYLNGQVMLTGSPGVSSPQDCFPLATYDTGLSLSDFGTFEVAYTLAPGTPGFVLFGDIGIKLVPEPNSSFMLLFASALFISSFRRHS